MSHSKKSAVHSYHLLLESIVKRYSLLWPALPALGLSLILTACGTSDTQTEDAMQTQQEEVVGVRVEAVQAESFAETLQTTGIIKAVEDVMLSAEEAGVVKAWKVRKGERVAKGWVLAVLSDDLLKASYDAAQAQFELAELNYEKQRSVFAENAISELQMKSAEYNRNAARAAADLALARLERTRLRSPIDGMVNDRFFDEGEFVSPGMPVAHLVNNARVKVSAEVPENYAGLIRLGSTITFTVDAYPKDTLTGTVQFVSAAVNPNNRTMTVEASVANPNGKLKPEMIARVRILRSEQRNAVLINQSVVQQVDRHRYVVYVENNGTVEERIVKLGGRQGNRVEVLEGLAVGDRVIVSGFQRLVHGQRVSVAG